MRNLILSALILASAFQTALGEQDGDWTYAVSNGEATITLYTGTGGAVEIPSEVNGIPVVKVGNSQFSLSGSIENNTITSITVPNGVTSIGDFAFGGLTGLRILVIGNSVTSIGYAAFSDLRSLTRITLPYSMTSIGNSALQNCVSLASITIPDSVTSIGGNAFSGCIGLTSVTIGSGVTSIGNGVFHNCTGLTTITIPNGVRSIGDGAFQGCTGLTTITIPSSVTSIGNNALLYCTGLTSITMPDRYIAQVAQIGVSGQVATDYLVNALANNDAFVTAVANKIKATSGNYGIATQSGLSTAIEPLATKTELTSSLTQSRTDGINSVLSNPNLWTLYTTSQIQNMAVGDLLLTKDVAGTLTLNYDIEQSTDLQTWTTYEALSLPLEGLPTDKAFVRIKAKQ